MQLYLCIAPYISAHSRVYEACMHAAVIMHPACYRRQRKIGKYKAQRNFSVDGNDQRHATKIWSWLELWCQWQVRALVMSRTKNDGCMKVGHICNYGTICFSYASQEILYVIDISCGLVLVKFTHIFQGYFTATGTNLRVPQQQWHNPEEYGQINHVKLLGTCNVTSINVAK